MFPRHVLLLLLAIGWLAAQTADVPTRFEVASVTPAKVDPSMPAMMRGFGRSSGGPGTTTPGQYTATGISLKNLLFRDAFKFMDYQYSAPDWMDKETYNVVAKVPPVTREQFLVMLKNLCIDRFQIKFHHEQREGTVYDLVVAKGGPKMKPSKFADDAPFASAGRGPIHLEYDADGFPVIPDDMDSPMGIGTSIKGQFVYATNHGSMKQLIDNISRNWNFPIIDKTGLTGKYKFTLHCAREGSTAPARTGTAAVSGDSAGAAVLDIDVAPTVFAAFQSQLGLKLEAHKGMIDVLVVDKAEKTPTEQ